jgi:Domain of unknown function (DUF4258)
MIGEHCLRRMFKRKITPEDVLETVRKGEIIKEYPEDNPYPSFLILSFVNKRPIHVVVARNEMDDLCFVVTVYEPDKSMWSNDFKIKLYE